MAVGTIGTITVSSITSNSVTFSFLKPANVTSVRAKFLDSLTNPLTGPNSELIDLTSYSVGAKVTHTTSTLQSSRSYYLDITPSNGSTAGTKTRYTNSNHNLITTHAASIITIADIGFNIQAANAGLPTAPPVTVNVNTGQVQNTGTSGSSSGSPSIVAGSLNPVPNDLNQPSRKSIKVTGLKPSQTYSIQVRAVGIDENGKTVYSPYSAALNINTPVFSASGNNLYNPNTNTDNILAGGSVVASSTSDPLGINTGSINLATDTVNGTGVILNQTGLAGYKSGVKKFYIDASNGDAYFAGTLSVGSLTDAGGVTNSALSSTLSGYRTTTSTIGAGYITTGILKSGGFTGDADGNPYSGIGMAINLDNNTFTSQSFRIDTNGNANFLGSVTTGNTTYAQLSADSGYGALDFYIGGTLIGSLLSIEGYIGLYGENDETLTLEAGDIVLGPGINGSAAVSPSSPSFLYSGTTANMALRNIAFQNGGTASGYNDGDIIFIY